tara:strand:- start:2612 stop:5017 length:2406 start_codon:yes stop_codon:yes gene_type:complete
MATTENFYTGNTSTTSFGYSFPILQNSDLKVELDGVIKTENTSGTNNDYSISGTNVVFNSAPGQGVDIHIYRQTNVDAPKAVFAPGSSIRAGDLNNIVDQALFANQEQQQKIRTADVRDNAVTSAKIKDGAIVNADINASADIDNSKIADGLLKSGITINSANIVNGSIVNDDINSSANISGTKLADGTTPAAKLSTGALPTGVTVASANIVNGTIVDGDIQTGTLDNRYYTETELNAGQLDNRYFTETELNAGQLDNRYYTETELNAGQLDNRYYTETQLNPSANAGQNVLDARYFTETELTNGALDGRYYTETEAEAKFLRQDSSETIASGQTWSNSDAFVATTAAINARIVDLIDEVGGFTAIANETSFPTTNPQGATGQAAILSIAAASTTLTPSGTTLTIANGAGTGNTVTVTGVPTAIPQNFGFLVESTSTLHTYTFHRLVPIATQVNTVASNIANIVQAGANVVDINNFADIYQISGSAPTQRADGTSLQEGDLWFDSSNDNLLVYTGNAFSIITPSQSVLDDVAIVSGAITYSEDLGLITNPVTTGSSNGSLDIVADALEDEITFTVTAATGKFIIDGVDKPALTLYKGWTYTFDVSDASNANHPLRFHGNTAQYTTNVTVTGTQGQAGAKVVIKIPETQPTGFHYYCTNHSGMGNTITVKDDPLKTVSDNITSIQTTATNINNVNTTATSISNVNTVGASIADVNRYANEYKISASAPSNPSNGDLWFDTSNNVLKNYNGNAWLGITSNSGIADVVDDTSPQLGGALDAQNNNFSNVGTIDGANLQLDFGTL